MDIITNIMRIVRETIQASGAPPDLLQDALAEAEARSRRALGGAMHYAGRVPQQPTKTRIIELAETAPDLTPRQIGDRLGVSDRYVRRVISQLRIE